jgi:pilus assembly protein CpaF
MERKLQNGFPQAQDSFQELKTRLHKKLIERLDLKAFKNIDQNYLKEQVREVAELIITEENLVLSPDSRQQLVTEIQNETLGLGPIEQYLADNEVSDILCNTHKQVYVEKRGKLHLTDTQFQDDNHLMLIIDRILSKVGRRIDESSPLVDARLMDGSRVHAVIPPIALDGPMLSIRK